MKLQQTFIIAKSATITGGDPSGEIDRIMAKKPLYEIESSKLTIKH